MVVGGVDGKLKVMVVRRCDLEAMQGGEDLVQRFRLVRVKAGPERPGGLYYILVSSSAFICTSRLFCVCKTHHARVIWMHGKEA